MSWLNQSYSYIYHYTKINEVVTYVSEVFSYYNCVTIINYENFMNAMLEKMYVMRADT